MSLSLLVVTAPSAYASAPIKIRLVDPAINSSPANERVMLQMTADGQQDQTGRVVQFYGPTGSLTSTFTIPAPVSNGIAGRTILLAPAGSVPAPDFDLGSSDRLDPTGGGVCFDAPPIPDCVTWGSFPSALFPTLPDPPLMNAPGMVPPNSAILGRIITHDCPTWLGPLDDSGNGAADFAGSPFPRNNSEAPVPGQGEVLCRLDTGWNQTPSNPTNDTTPTFAFGPIPQDYSATFMCSFEGVAFTPCDPDGITYGPLADGTYNFRTYAQNGAGPDLSPSWWTFDVDTVPPDTAIDSTPPPISSGFSATFIFHSSEPKSKFQCQFESGPIQTCEPGKTIFSLADGPHSFRVWAIDQATNVDPTPAEATFHVDTTLGDRTPPDTSILSRPSNPSSSARATFTYRSNEPRSTFECSLDGRPFGACDVAGISYPRLKNGPHAFRVRAIDRAGNADSVPASFAWSIRAALPETRITASPPGFQRIAGRAKTLPVSFAFRSSEPRSTFRCRVDGQKFKPCRSPRKLKATCGRHRFEVYAIDAVGNVEPVPARRIFRIGAGGGKGFLGAGCGG